MRKDQYGYYGEYLLIFAEKTMGIGSSESGGPIPTVLKVFVTK